MSNGLICLLLVLISTPLLLKAYQILPRERFQIIGAIPRGNTSSRAGGWTGTNLTYYGFILASATVTAVALFFVLLAAIGIDKNISLWIIAFVVILSLIGAKLIAKLVEKKKNTLTVAGGATVGLYAMTLTLTTYNGFYADVHHVIPLFPVMAALTVSFIIGEGLGRLACISFGCCYGKPITELSPLSKRLLGPFGVEFHGRTKKIIYASGLSGVKVLPIQAITSFVYIQCGIVGIYLFFEGKFAASFALCAIFSLAWRIFSEQFRADYRGEGKISTYQIMGFINIFFCLALLYFVPPSHCEAGNFILGLRSLWSPMVILFLQIMWLIFFLYTGISRVIGATLTFHIRQNQI